ncbi:MAG: FKBP-type peptidyl-prolyl cis-trans isomerase [Propionibacteriaceae bacterium]|nr:FKBP-type peptidyl-prolyl cis-trans isomerase [Propionibacteriaceae bacterium]
MRNQLSRLLPLTLAALVWVSALSGCAGSATPAPTKVNCGDAFTGITYESADGVPSLTFGEGGIPASTTDEYCLFAEGGVGDPIKVGQYLTFNWAEYDQTGRLVESGTDTGEVQEPTAGHIMSDILTGKKAGAVLGIIAPYDATTAHLIVLQVASVSDEAPEADPTRAWGTPNPQINKDIPAVALADDGEPSITPLSADPPAELVVQVLLEGDGAEVAADQTITIQYAGWLWDGTAFDSSWSKSAPSTFSLTGLIKGWQQGLVGQKVGSQVELVIPPELGYGESGNGSIPGGATLVFVVDILAAS